MKRREFLVIVVGAVLPLAANAQQPVKMPRVLHLSPVDIPSQVASYRTQLRELGYIEGRNIRFDFRHAAGDVDRLPAIVEEAVKAGDIDIILAISTPAALAAFKATKTIPIVAFTAVDPVGSGLAKSLASPGGNVTGIAVFAEETNVKRVELLREAFPRAIRLATVTSKLSAGSQNLRTLFDAGSKLGFTVENLMVNDPADLTQTLNPKILAGFDALVFTPDVLLSSHMAEVIKLVTQSGRPAIFPAPDWVQNGGLMSFGPDFTAASRQVVAQLDRVLKGAQPRDLPFERPTKFDFRINLRTARAMGIEPSPMLLARADEVVE